MTDESDPTDNNWRIILTSTAVIADISAVGAALTLSDPIAVVAALSAGAIVISLIVLVKQWGQPIGRWTVASAGLALLGAFVLGSTTARSVLTPSNTVAPTVEGWAPTQPDSPEPNLTASPMTETTLPTQIEQSHPSGGYGYAQVFDRQEITVPYEKDCSGLDYRIDLDKPQVGTTEGADLSFGDYCFGPKIQRYGSPVGRAAKEPSSPLECESIARTQAVEDVAANTFKPNETSFCIITDRGAVAWLVHTGRIAGDDFTFELSLWVAESS